jgi:hypothetical protein
MYRCNVCGDQVAQTKHLDLYAFGSEGVNACNACESAIIGFIRVLNAQSIRAVKQAHKRLKARRALLSGRWGEV